MSGFGKQEEAEMKGEIVKDGYECWQNRFRLRRLKTVEEVLTAEGIRVSILRVGDLNDQGVFEYYETLSILLAEATAGPSTGNMNN